MIRNLTYYGDPILKKKAKEVDEVTDDIRMLIQDMYETMVHHKGVGLAAPQVGVSLRIFIMDVEKETEDGQLIFCEFPRIYINPVLSEPSSNLILGNEGCLSIPGLRADVYRPDAVTIQAKNLDGHVFTERLENFVARIAMHETDHLDGILYVDKMEPPKDQKYFQRVLKNLRHKFVHKR